MTQPLWITGMGICCPIGNDLETVSSALQAGISGIRPIQSFDCSELVMRHAGEVPVVPQDESCDRERFRGWDRGTRLAMHAALQAFRDARIDWTHMAPERIGVCCGTSGSGQYQNARFGIDRSFQVDRTLTFFLSRNSPHFQSSQIAAQLGIVGPNMAIGAATAGGGIAFATAMAWLRSGMVDAVLVGGGESFSLLNVLGFDQLGLSLPHPCTPFHDEAGMTFGEGAGYIVLETQESAERRGVVAYAELQSAAIRADGFDPILFDPSGNGQSRAMQTALASAGLNSKQIDWIRASGTGGRDQDLAETLAVKSVFETPPPISSLEPYLGHANGAGPAIGLIAAVLCMKRDLIPATQGCKEPRVGCDLDYVTEGPRRQKLQHVMCNTAAFGGTNCSIIVKNSSNEFAAQTRPQEPMVNDGIVISGIGVVSSRGCGNHLTLGEIAPGVAPEINSSAMHPAATPSYPVTDFSPRKHCPMVKLRGIEPLTQFAAGATAMALSQAKLSAKSFDPNRVGTVTSIARTSGSVFAKLFEELPQDGFRPSIGRLMLRNGRFMIASQLSCWFDLRGFSSSISLGIGSGLHAMVAAYQQLLTDPSLDAIVVVTADELSPFTLDVMRASGLTSSSSDASSLYSKSSQGIVPSEGAVAIVIERASMAAQRGIRPLAEIRAGQMSFDGLAGAAAPSDSEPTHWQAIDESGSMLAHCIRQGCEEAQIDAQQIDQWIGNGCGNWSMDRKELSALQQVLGSSTLPYSLNRSLGVAETTSSLFNLVAGVAKLQSSAASHAAQSSSSSSNSMPGTSTAVIDRQHAMVFAGTEQGQNAAMLLASVS